MSCFVCVFVLLISHMSIMCLWFSFFVLVIVLVVVVFYVYVCVVFVYYVILGCCVVFICV